MSIRPLVIVAIGDRTMRRAVDQRLRAMGVGVRVASRPAELAKALADGMATLVVASAAAEDDHIAQLAHARVHLVRIGHAEDLQQVTACLPSPTVTGTPSQPTSSA